MLQLASDHAKEFKYFLDLLVDLVEVCPYRAGATTFQRRLGGFLLRGFAAP